MTETERLAELLATDLASLCERHHLMAFVESSSDGVRYHLLPQQLALAQILSEWRPPARMN